MKFTHILYSILAVAATMTIGCNSSPVAKNDRMDLNTKPGDDFYQYASGRWISQLPEKPEYSRYNQFDILGEINEERTLDIITHASNGNPAQGTIEQKISDYYTLCMDSARLNQEGASPVKNILDNIQNSKNRKEFIELCASLKKRGINGLFVSSWLQGDITNATDNIVTLYQGGISLKRDYYLNDDTATLKILNSYKEYVNNLFRLAGFGDKEATSKTDAVIEIETKIANGNYDKNKLREPKDNYHKTTVQELKKQFPEVDWVDYFTVQGIQGFEYLNVAQPEAIANVSHIIAHDDMNDLKSYAQYKVLNTAAPYLSDDFVNEIFELSKAMYGVKSDKPRWQKAVSEVNSSLGMAVGKLYVDKYFPESSKQIVLDMMYKIQDALRSRIEQLEWMSKETKAKAIDKLNSFYIMVGYPNEWQDYSTLTIDKNKSLIDNYMAICEYESNREIANKLNKPVNSNEWLMTPQTINAYYNPKTNGITIPAAILQPPFFDPNADEAANYGGIGCVIGHEMTHGFDDQGRKYDKHGTLVNWWTDSDNQEFEERAKLMEQFFSNLDALPGEKADGQYTLGENIADHGGIKVSFLAFQNAMKKKPLKDKDGFTPEQRFFLSYGFIWAGKITDENMRNRIKTDPHSPMHLRVNGQLPHLQPWYDAFNVKEGDKMYLEESERVDIW
ncbi:MAG: M13 family metallopeptidase [Bacteroidales bacterium]|nr:M13 family metallopeptidase [Bacteroidales bacterium]